MLKLFKNNFKTTNDCIILATPLIIFISVLRWYFVYAVNSVDNLPKMVLAFVTLVIMFAGFLSAWLNMVKKTIALSKKVFIFDKDRVKALWYLVLTLPRGIGRLFLPVLLVTIILICIYSLLIYSVNYLVDYKFLASLVVSIVVAYFTLLWIPEIVYNEKNPFKALWYSMRKMFTLRALAMFFVLVLLTILSKFVSLIVLINPVLYFFVLIYYYYYIIYVVVLLFTYYEQNYIDG